MIQYAYQTHVDLHMLSVSLSVTTEPQLPFIFNEPSTLICQVERTEIPYDPLHAHVSSSMVLHSGNDNICSIWWDLLTPQSVVPIGHADLLANNNLRLTTRKLRHSPLIELSTIHIVRVSSETIGQYTCHLACGDQVISDSIYLSAVYGHRHTEQPSHASSSSPTTVGLRKTTPSDKQPEVTTPTPTTTKADPMCSRMYHCISTDRATTTLAGFIALLVIIGISVLGCIVAMGQTRRVCCCLSILEPLAPFSESTANLPQSDASLAEAHNNDPPKYDDVVTNSPPPTGLYRLEFTLPNTDSIMSPMPSPLASPSSSSNLIQQLPTTHTIDTEQTEGICSSMRSSPSTTSWSFLPSYFQVIRDWATRGIVVNTERLSDPPPRYDDVEKGVAESNVQCSCKEKEECEKELERMEQHKSEQEEEVAKSAAAVVQEEEEATAAATVTVLLSTNDTTDGVSEV